MKLGVLYPRSKEHPGMMVDFVDGIKTALKHKQLDQKIQLVLESIGFGGVEKEVYEKAEKLLELEGVDMLVAFVDLRILEILRPLMLTTGKMLMAVNPGANYPDNWLPQKNILNLTLQHGFLCWLSGKQAAQMNKINAALVTTFYDCGYKHTAAMIKGFVEGGAEITHNHVNNQKYDDAFEIRPLTSFLSSNQDTDTLLCVFDSYPAYLFYSRLNEYKEASNLHLFVSPMMLENKALEKIADGFTFSINGYKPWHASLTNKDNIDFLESLLEQTKSPATVFSLLGWESAEVVEQIFLNSNEDYTNSAAITAKLAEGIINSPRGGLRLDTKTNYFIAPVCKCSISQNSATLLTEWMDIPEKEWAGFVDIPAEGVSSGWMNTYLCY